MTHFLHHEIASEAAGRLDDDGPHTVALNRLEHGGEAGAHIDGISTAHGRIVELINQLVPRPLSECLDCRPLALVAVQRRLLRTHRERPYGSGAAEQHDEVATLHAGHGDCTHLPLVFPRAYKKQHPASLAH